jgi:hypothetical protein
MHPDALPLPRVGASHVRARYHDAAARERPGCVTPLGRRMAAAEVARIREMVREGAVRNVVADEGAAS